MVPMQLEAYNLFHEGVLALSRAQEHGMCIDVEYCERKKRQLTHKIERYKSEFEASKLFINWTKTYGAKTNIDSSTQLAHMLYDVMNITPAKKTKKGRGSTDDDALSRLDIPEVKMLLKMKKLVKVRDTYLEAFLREQVDGILHPFFNLHTTKTFRSCVAKGSDVYVPCLEFNPLRTCRTKKIEEIRKGDVVWCAVGDTFHRSKFVCGEVAWAGKTGHRKVLALTFLNTKTQEEHVIRVTPEHKIMD